MTLTPMQIMQQGIMNALALSVFAQALGIVMAATGLETAPTMLTAGDPAIEDLRKAYGDDVVSRALTDVPSANAVELAKRVEYYVHQDLRSRYGEWAANTAIEVAPPGDMHTAIEVARSLSSRNVTPSSTMVEKATAVARGKLRGRSKAEPQRDTKTGIEYKSKSAAGMAVATEYGESPTNTYAWYAVIRKDPNRFVPV